MRIYFLGICGTAMGNVALLLRSMGHEVLGADTGIYPPMSDYLRQAGIEILEGWSAERLAKLKPDLVVVGNIASRGHPEVEWLLCNPSQAYVSLPELLRTQLLNQRRNIVVAGTHGKTTTTCLAAYLLRAQGLNPGWLVGGVPRDLPEASFAGQKGGPFVIEGDEYDTAFFDKRSKFIQYLPHVLAINNCEFDHADIFRDLTDVLRTFSHVLRIVPSNGAVVANGDDANVASLLTGVTWAPIWRVGVGPGNDAVIQDFKETPEGASFTLSWRGRFWGKVSWSLPGIFNARNAAMAAVSAGLLIDAQDPTNLSLAPLAEFRGVQRRQQVLVSRPQLVVIEDFGHHPTALQLTLESLRARYPQHTLVACFEPRSNTAARKVMQDAFQAALQLADEVFLSPPHRGDKLGEARFDSDGVAAALTQAGRLGFAPSSNEALLSTLLERTRHATQPRCVVFFSNGSFGGIIKKFAESV